MPIQVSSLKPFVLMLILTVNAAMPVADDNIGHTHHFHTNNAPHAKVNAPERFYTNRQGAEILLPEENDAFTFIVFGDRTGGSQFGVSVLADAVYETNLIEPDLVMTVGDMVNGYNPTDEWLQQMKEYRSIMNQLLCPWFPVAGNHDVYWPGENKPKGQHEKQYEMYFGPLWYAFEHKNCWFIALYSDEGNLETGEKAFNKPASQTMSPTQFEWLKSILEKAKDADHVFCFLHHPRWIGGGYGRDWDRVHNMLQTAGNVSAVFAGHIHHMRYDKRDDIEYVTMATTGGAQNGSVPDAGYLHQYTLVTVRKDQLALASIPVGEVQDVRAITGEISKETALLAKQDLKFTGEIVPGSDGQVNTLIKMKLKNTASQPIEVTLYPESRDSRWQVTPDHQHQLMAPGNEREFTFKVNRPANSVDPGFDSLTFALSIDYLAKGFRYTIPTLQHTPMHDLSALKIPAIDEDMMLMLDGDGDVLAINSDDFKLPDGPFTLEARFRANDFDYRTTLIGKSENSDYAISVNDGIPRFTAYVGGKYRYATNNDVVIEKKVWHHIAGVYDGNEMRLYLDGKKIADYSASGSRTTNSLPLIIGGDVNQNGSAGDFFNGDFDEIHLSSKALYTDATCPVREDLVTDDATVLYMDFTRQLGRWVYSTQDAEGILRDHATIKLQN